MGFTPHTRGWMVKPALSVMFGNGLEGAAIYAQKEVSRK